MIYPRSSERFPYPLPKGGKRGNGRQEETDHGKRRNGGPPFNPLPGKDLGVSQAIGKQWEPLGNSRIYRFPEPLAFPGPWETTERSLRHQWPCCYSMRLEAFQ